MRVRTGLLSAIGAALVTLAAVAGAGEPWPFNLPPGFPIANANNAQFETLSKRPIVASDDEVAQNPRARSAKLRAVRKLSGVTS